MSEVTLPSSVVQNSPPAPRADLAERRACTLDANPEYTLAEVLKLRSWTAGCLPATWLDCMMYVAADTAATTPATFLREILRDTRDLAQLVQIDAETGANARALHAVLRRLVALERLAGALVKQEAVQARQEAATKAAVKKLATMRGTVQKFRRAYVGKSDAVSESAAWDLNAVAVQLLLTAEEIGTVGA